MTVTANLSDNFIHPAGGGTNTFDITGLTVVASDQDGDSTTAAVTVVVTDDVPTVTGLPASAATVAEDAADIGGTWALDEGADGVADADLVVEVNVGGGDTIYTMAQAVLGITVTNTASDELGVLTVNAANKTWNFDPSLDIDNTDGAADVVNFTIKATDADGDIASDSHTINLTDGSGPGDANGETAGITLAVDEAAMDSDNAPAISFTAGSDALTSFVFGNETLMTLNTNGIAGNDVSWNRVSDTEIRGTVDGQVALTLTISAPPASIAAGTSGDVTVTANLSDNFIHPAGDGTTSFDIDGLTVVASDQDGNSTTAAVTVVVTDDVPTAVVMTNDGQVTSATDTNLMLILDVSGSMGDPSGYQGMTRLEVMVKSSLELLEQYEAQGEVKVNLITFSSSASNPSIGWADVATIKALLLDLNDNGWTNYDDALNDAINAFGQTGAISNAQNISYFMSDGEPNNNDVTNAANVPDGNNNLGGGAGIDSDEQNDWEQFLSANNINSFALGMGTSVSATSLNPIAYDGITNTDPVGNTIIVSDLALLESVLVSTIAVSPVQGVLINGGLSAQTGADGGLLESITIDGVTYKFDGTVSSGTSAGSFGSGVWTITTPAGAEFIVTMSNGMYEYTPSTATVSVTIETFGYTVIDDDGDTASSTLTITIDPAEGPMVVRDDYVVTNQDNVEIADWALLSNDSGPDSATQAITGVSGAATDGAGSVTYTGGSSDGSFGYTNTAGAQTDSAVVTINKITGNTIEGDPYDYLDEILIGGTAAETLNGGAGDDILIGGDGVVAPPLVRITADGDNSDSNDDYLQFEMLAGTASVSSIVIDLGASDNNAHFDAQGGGNDWGPDISSLIGFTGTVNTAFSQTNNHSESAMTVTFSGDTFEAGDSFNMNLRVHQLGGDDGDDWGDGGVTATVTFSDNTTQVLTFVEVDSNTSIAESSAAVSDDILNGGDGDDILVGSAGSDILTGGDGADEFVFNLSDLGSSGAPANDEITDFNESEGDVINLADVLGDEDNSIAGVENDGHLQIQVTNAGDGLVQTIDVNIISVVNDVAAQSALDSLIISGAVDDGI